MSKTDSFFNPDQYATVAERIELFYARFPEGRINTDLVGRADGEITFKAHIYRSAAETQAAATGWASEREGDGDINTVACLENTETSAVGRALANLGFTTSNKRPSREEMEKAARVRQSLSFKERARDGKASIQRQADMAEDILRLIAKSEKAGFPAHRAEVVRLRVNKLPGLPPARARKIEASLRNWLRRREM